MYMSTHNTSGVEEYGCALIDHVKVLLICRHCYAWYTLLQDGLTRTQHTIRQDCVKCIHLEQVCLSALPGSVYVYHVSVYDFTQHTIM